MSKDQKKGKDNKGIKLETAQQSKAYSELVKVKYLRFRNNTKY